VDHDRTPGGLSAELRDAISLRAVVLVVGVFVLQMAFIVSYVGAFHAPKPYRIPVGVVAPAQVGSALVEKVNSLPSRPLQARLVADEAAARQLLTEDRINAALVVDASGTSDRLLVASASGSAVVTAVETAVTQLESRQHRTTTTVDVVPLQRGDERGLTGFYLVIGWLVGGYLVASLIGVAAGARPATVRRTVIRLGALAVYAIVSGLGGAVIVDPVLGALTGHFVALWWVGALLVFAAAAVTTALQVLFGITGIGLAVLLFVVLGNPSAGGAYQLRLLPPFWRAIGYAIPNGAGTEAVRRIVYFGGRGITSHLLVIAAYAFAGCAVALLGARLRRPPGDPSPDPAQ